MISVIIPTIPVRAKWLERIVAAYEATTEDWELIVERGHDTCSKGWNAGVEKAQGDFIQFSADDVEPRPGWWQAAISCAKTGALPCADLVDAHGLLTHCGDSGLGGKEGLIHFREGSVTPIARVPFFPRELVGKLTPVMENHYMSDYWIAWRAAQLGWPTVVVHSYLFVHHHALEGRLYTLEADEADYNRLIEET